MNKRGLLFVSILLVLVSSAYAPSQSSCSDRCTRQGYEFGTCGGSEMATSAWIDIGPTGCTTNNQICFCKISTPVSPPQTGQPGLGGGLGGIVTTITNLFTSQKYDIPSEKTGSMVCDELGGVCREIECLKSQIIFNVWGDCGRDQENRIIGCNFLRSSIWQYNKVRASCSCIKENVCYGGMSYEKNTDCTLGKILDDCAAKDMKCSGGECARCIDGFYEENGACIYGTRPTTIPSGNNPPVTPPTLDSECTQLCKTSAYNADIGYCLNLEKPQGPLSVSIGTNPERIENKKINLDAQTLIFTGQQKNCIGLIANDPGNQQDNEFETCLCVECGDNKKWENNKCIPCGTDETWDATTKKCIVSPGPAGVEKCGNRNLDSGEVCDTLLTPIKVCTEIDITQYSDGRATCKQDCSGWDITNCITKTSPDTEKKVQISNVFCDNCIGDNFIYPYSPFTVSCEASFTPAQTSFSDIDFIEASFDNKKCTKITNEVSIFYFGCSSGAAQDSRKKLSCTIDNQKATSKEYVSGGEDKNLDIKVTTEGNPCKLTSAKIELQGTDNKANPGDKIKVTAVVTGDCTSAKYFQLDANSLDNTCKIEYTGGTLSGFTKQNPTFPLTFEWPVPSDLKECIDKTVTATGAALWPDVPGKTGTTQISTASPTGSFTFVSAQDGGQTKCGDGTKGADEVCDKQLTPNKPCISINANLYSSGTATCKEDCTGWITTNCGLKTVECQDGTRKCADGTCKADCGGNELTCNSDGTCDATESCTCSDCYGRKDSCQEGSICDAVTEQCKPTTPGCGNGIIDSGEQCDCWSNNYLCSSQELNYQSCQLQGRSDGQYLSCYLPSRVGLGCKFNLEACDNPSRSCWNQGNKPCITSDGCDGEIKCENGVLMGDCIKIDSTCLPPITQYQCIDSATNADLCSSDNLGLIEDTQITIVPSCTDAKKCEFTCKSGFKLESGQCVQQTTILCGTGPIPTTGCQCPEGTPKYSGYCCRNAQNDLVYQDIPCDQTPTSDFTVKFTYEVKGITATFTASNPLLNYFEWDFGDGNKQEGGQNLYTVSHTYIFDGSEKSFTVNLIAHNAEGKTATASNVIKIEKSISDLPNTETCNVRGNSLALCHSSLDGCFLGSESECESCRVVSKCEDFSDDGLACRGEIPGCDRYACDWDENNVCLPKQVSEQDCQYVCIDLADESVEGYYFNGKKEYPQTCETGTCWECPTEGCKFTSPDGTTTITYIDGECVNGFKEVTIKNSGIAQDQTIIQPCSLSPVISFFTLFNIILTLSILTVFYIFRKKF